MSLRKLAILRCFRIRGLDAEGHGFSGNPCKFPTAISLDDHAKFGELRNPDTFNYYLTRIDNYVTTYISNQCGIPINEKSSTFKMQNGTM